MYYLKQLIGLMILLSACCAEIAATPARVADQPLVNVLNKIQEEYKVVFSFNTKDVKSISIQFEWKSGEAFESAINRALKDTGLKYKSVGLNFFVIYKYNKINKRKLNKINRKIKQIKKLGNSKDFIITDKSELPKVVTKRNSKTIKGTITDHSGEALIGASILVVDKEQGTSSDLRGNFELQTAQDAKQLIVSYTGFLTQQVDIAGKEFIKVKLKKGLNLECVTVFGARGVQRTRFNSTVPIDHFSISELNKTSGSTLDEQLTQIVPSFNSGQHPVSDASAHFNPVDLRGLLPSRTLVLVNGKRKNASALLYSYVTASRGEVGVDLKSIHPSTVKAVEVLRDGATAQYGSDAIAGVINLELKNQVEPFINTGYSITNQLDGTQFDLASGYSFDISDKGFATFTLGYHEQNRSQRAGKVTSAEDEANHWGTSVFTVEQFRDYLERLPSAGFQVGLPDVQSFNASVNAAYSFGTTTDTKLYIFGTLMNRSGKSPQFARSPYWVTGFEAIYPNADYFLPEMAPKINDQMLSIGLKHVWREWKMDIGTTFGNNRIDYFIQNSFNQSLGSNSPKNFYNGAHQFRHLVNNLDINKTFYLSNIKKLTVAFGVEQRLESFKGFAGEFASYGDGTPNVIDRVGSESFSGLNPYDAVNGTRSNIGFYTELSSDLSANILIGGAIRFENYNDFGTNLSWKINGLYKIIKDKLNFRAAISNGFRAPSLHQIHYTSTTTTLTPSGVVQNRILNNLDPALNYLAIPKLMPEISRNLSTGLTLRLSKNIGLSFDAYKIMVEDRIVLSGQIGKSEYPNSPVNQLLESTNTASAGFFLNAVNTTTKGLDIVLYAKELKLGKGQLQTSFAMNLNRTKVTDVRLPDFIEDNRLKDEIFSREDISRLETWRPQEKIIFSSTYSVDKFSATIGTNYFGKVIYRHPNNPNDDATFSGKMITNWAFGYDFNSKIKFQLGVNNLFDVYPDSFSEAYQGNPKDRNIDFVGRFQYPWQTLQIGIDGVRAFTKLTVEL